MIGRSRKAAGENVIAKRHPRNGDKEQSFPEIRFSIITLQFSSVRSISHV